MIWVWLCLWLRPDLVKWQHFYWMMLSRDNAFALREGIREVLGLSVGLRVYFSTNWKKI